MLKCGLKDILTDRTSGASALYRKTIELFKTDPVYKNHNRLLKDLDRISNSFSEMAPFIYLKQRLKSPPAGSRSDTLTDLLNELQSEERNISEYLSLIWKKKCRVITFSQSSCVLNMLLQRRNLIKSVLISIAAPSNEGVLAARKILRAGIKVALTTDAALPGMIKSNDLVLVGADCVTEKYFVNKTGTLPLLVMAARMKAKRVVVAESFKTITASDYQFSPRAKSAGEIISRRPRDLTVINEYFEKIPLELITCLISGMGIIRN